MSFWKELLSDKKFQFGVLLLIYGLLVRVFG
jgi:hypothetical protein